MEPSTTLAGSGPREGRGRDGRWRGKENVRGEGKELKQLKENPQKPKPRNSPRTGGGGMAGGGGKGMPGRGKRKTQETKPTRTKTKGLPVEGRGAGEAGAQREAARGKRREWRDGKAVKIDKIGKVFFTKLGSALGLRSSR